MYVFCFDKAKYCRKQGGSASNTGTVVPLDQVEWIKGEEHIKSWVKPTGFRSDFCNNCGSPVPNPLREFDYYWIPVRTLDDADFEIVISLWTEAKASWGVLAPDSEHCETMPSFEEFIALLRSHQEIDEKWAECFATEKGGDQGPRTPGRLRRKVL